MSELPHNLEAERVVLGAILVNPLALASAAVTLKPEHFYERANRRIYQAMLDMADLGEAVDVITLKNELSGRGYLESVGGAAYLGALIEGVPSIENIESWATIIQEHATVRRIHEAGSRIAARCLQGGAEATAVVEQAYHEVLAAAADDRSSQGFGDPREDIKLAEDRLTLMATAKGGVTGVSTGLADLDDTLGGLHAGEVIIVGARPGQGKTALALNIAEHAAKKGHVVAMFSLEMTRAELGVRRLCCAAGVNLQEIRGRETEGGRYREALAISASLMSRPLYIDDTPSLSTAQIRAKLQRLQVRHKVGLVIVDYLQLIEGPKAENRQQQVTAISRAMKILAKDFMVPVLALSQLNRGTLERADKRPNLEDLRESGSLEQDADVVLLIHRPEFYTLQKGEAPDPEDVGTAEIIVAKQRNGPTTRVRVQFTKETGRFGNLAAGSWRFKCA